MPVAERERGRLVVPADRPAGFNPADLPPRVLSEPEEDPGGLVARQGRCDREFDPGPADCAWPGLLDPWHALAAHPDRGQHRVGTACCRRSLRHADEWLPVSRHVPVAGARTEPGEQVPEHALLELRPGLRVEPPPPEVSRLIDSAAESLHRLV